MKRDNVLVNARERGLQLMTGLRKLQYCGKYPIKVCRILIEPISFGLRQVPGCPRIRTDGCCRIR